MGSRSRSRQQPWARRGGQVDYVSAKKAMKLTVAQKVSKKQRTEKWMKSSIAHAQRVQTEREMELRMKIEALEKRTRSAFLGFDARPMMEAATKSFRELLGKFDEAVKEFVKRTKHLL